jgi:hypothetical protein
VPASTPPPSSAIPGKSGGSAPYVVGILILALLTGGLIWWRTKEDPPPAPTPPATVTAQQVKTAPVPIHAPPPPPPIEEDAGVEDSGAGKTATTGKPGLPGPGTCDKCLEGEGSSALDSALRSTAQSAQGCYNRALRKSEVSGSLTVSVQVGSNGQVCGVSIGPDTVNSSEVSSCVRGRFQGKSFPPPKKGCVTRAIPISFSIKQP